jgi:predicted enzyme related to lactoylglutathione lyase
VSKHLLLASFAFAAVSAALPAVAAEAPAGAYLEFNVHDAARAKAFYGAVFGWSFTDYGPDYISFAADGVSGGFVKTADVRPGGALIVFHAADLARAQARVIAAGGTITRPPFAFPGGRRFHFRDLDGYEVAVWSEAGQ